MRNLANVFGLAVWVGVLSVAGAPKTDEHARDLYAQLAQAQAGKNLERVEQIAREMETLLGERAGVPEEPTQYQSVSDAARPLTKSEVLTGYNAYLTRLQKSGESWWLKPIAATEIPAPLRFVASVVSGSLAARRAGCQGPERLMEIACQAGEYLRKAQQEAGNGVFPFPAWRGKSGRLGMLSERFLRRAEQEGILNQVTTNGWMRDDRGGGDLYFDNGLCGVALLDLFEATKETKWLSSARAAADWAAAQPVVPNWNYNSFSVYLLAEAFRVTGQSNYLAAAKEKARLGIYPGQLRHGPHSGLWADPHNAKPAYHYILCRGMAALLKVLPANDPDWPRCRETLERALLVRNLELLNHGLTNPDTVMEVLALLELRFPDGDSRLASVKRKEALDLVARHASERLRQGHLPVSPFAWGLYLESLAASRGRP
ncbi:MAG: hypothetical protein WCO56_10240 [Verrucomicrobiota bacterium]